MRVCIETYYAHPHFLQVPCKYRTNDKNLLQNKKLLLEISEAVFMVFCNVFTPIIYKKRLFCTPIVPLLVCKSGAFVLQ